MKEVRNILFISREELENSQIWIYVVSLLIGGAFGIFNESMASKLEWTIPIIIAVLMYGMLAQIPFLKLREALSNSKFMFALTVGNFLAVPILVGFLIKIFPLSPPILVGVCLVLLTPCIDYVIVFTQLGKGNEKLILAATPILFLLQMILLPFYLFIFVGEEVVNIVKVGPFLEAFLFMIVIPLALAIITQLWASSSSKKSGEKFLKLSAWLPVPFMALVLIVVVATQIGKISNDFNAILKVIPIYVLYLIITPFISKYLAFVFKLEFKAGRALVFSIGTRNSLVVLPLALALPNEWATLAAAIIVTQTIVELIGELVYIKAVPKLIKK